MLVGSPGRTNYPVTGARTQEWSLTNAPCATRSSPGATTCPNTPRCTGARARADWPERASEAAPSFHQTRKSSIFLYFSFPSFLLSSSCLVFSRSVLFSVLTWAKLNLRDVIVQPRSRFPLPHAARYSLPLYTLGVDQIQERFQR